MVFVSPVSHGDYWASKPIVGLTAADRQATMILAEPKPSKPRRPRQRDCRHEPPYPGEETVMMSMSDPGTVMHGCAADLGARCYVTYPHPIAECREFISTSADEYREEHRWERVP